MQPARIPRLQDTDARASCVGMEQFQRSRNAPAFGRTRHATGPPPQLHPASNGRASLRNASHLSAPLVVATLTIAAKRSSCGRHLRLASPKVRITGPIDQLSDEWGGFMQGF